MGYATTERQSVGAKTGKDKRRSQRKRSRRSAHSEDIRAEHGPEAESNAGVKRRGLSQIESPRQPNPTFQLASGTATDVSWTRMGVWIAGPVDPAPPMAWITGPLGNSRSWTQAIRTHAESAPMETQCAGEGV